MVKIEESVLVVVRCRPLNAKEIEQELEESGERSGQKKDKHESHSSTPSSTGANAFVGGCVNMVTKVGLVEIRHPKSVATDPPKSFTFDYVYDWNSRQTELYEETFSPLVNSVLMGFNGTIFAYGQTGTGKTFTMEGIRDDPDKMGVIPRTFVHIFDDHIRSAPREEKYLVTASYLEIYQEEIRDLLSKEHLTKRLELRERPDTGVYVKDLTSFVCKSRSEIEHVMNVGNVNRSVSATNMNEHSSRSHAIFIVTIECSCPTEQNESHIRVGKLNLVDLAGSERQAKTGATGERLKEATKINLSLSALGNVISSLVDAKTSHIPYRDSKLTRLLQDSLGGNAKTVMVANIGPASFNYDESLTTLRYANRAKNIKNKPRINEDPKDALLREFQEEIARLKAQLSNRTGEKTKHRKKSSPKTSNQIEGCDISNDPELDTSQHDNSSGTDNSVVSSPEPPPEVENLESRLAVERDLLENDTTLLSTEKEKLLQDLASKEEKLKKEKEEKEAMMLKIKALESKLISGTGDINMVERTNEQQKMLEMRRSELAEIRRVERETAHQLEAQEELGEELGKTYTSLQQEVESKTRKLRKLFTKLQAVKQDINDVTEEYNRDRRDLEETQQQLLKELKLKVLIIENFIPPTEKTKLLSRCVYDEEEDTWKLSQNFENVLSKSAITKRPVSAAGSRRPISEYARMMSASSNSSNSSDYGGSLLGLGGIRYRGENIMRLGLDRGGRTTRDYEGPTVAPRVQAALDAAMHNVEPDIEVDVSALNAKLGAAPVRGIRKHTNGQIASKKNAKNCWKDKASDGGSNPGEAYPSSRGLVPKSSKKHYMKRCYC